jgi:hypothetical protein
MKAPNARTAKASVPSGRKVRLEIADSPPALEERWLLEQQVGKVCQ